MKETIANLDKWIGQKIKISDFTKADLAAYQLKMLKSTLKQASLRSPYYQKKLAGFSLEAIQSLDDLEKLPLTDQGDLKKEGMQFLAVNQKRIKRIVTLNSSGTTGPSKRIFFTENDLHLTIDFFKHGMALFTQENDRVLILMPGKAPASIGDLLKKALAELGAQGIIYGVVDDAKKVAKLIRDEEITGIVGIPQQILSVSLENESELIKRNGSLRSVLLSSDYVSPTLVAKIQKQWGVSVYEHYGSTEMGYGGGVFCDAKSGYHLREADFIFEIINPKTGKAVSAGESGEVVFTTLTREAMPLIRYRTGDISCFLEADCPCLTKLKTMNRVAHRLDNKVALGRASDFTLSSLEDLIFLNSAVDDFRVSLSDDQEIIDKQLIKREVVSIELVFKQDQPKLKRVEVIADIKKALLKTFGAKEGNGNHFRIDVSEGSPGEIDVKAMQKRKIIDRRSSNE